jgi:hypothetical protein
MGFGFCNLPFKFELADFEFMLVVTYFSAPEIFFSA